MYLELRDVPGLEGFVGEFVREGPEGVRLVVDHMGGLPSVPLGKEEEEGLLRLGPLLDFLGMKKREKKRGKASCGGLGDDPPKGGVCPLFRAMASFK